MAFSSDLGLAICLKSPPGSSTRCSVMLPTVGLGHGK